MKEWLYTFFVNFFTSRAVFARSSARWKEKLASENIVDSKVSKIFGPDRYAEGMAIGFGCGVVVVVVVVFRPNKIFSPEPKIFARTQIFLTKPKTFTQT